MDGKKLPQHIPSMYNIAAFLVADCCHDKEKGYDAVGDSAYSVVCLMVIRPVLASTGRKFQRSFQDEMKPVH